MKTTLNKQVKLSIFKQYFTIGILSLIAFTATAEETTELIIHEGGFLKPATYSIGSGEPKPLGGVIGLNNVFIDEFSRNPQAYKTIRQSDTYAKVSSLGMGIVLAGSVMMLLDTLDQAEEVNNNQIPEDNDKQTQALTVVVVGAIVTVISGQMAKSNLRKAVELYNKKQQTSFLLNQENGFQLAKHEYLSFGLKPENRDSQTWNIKTTYKYFF